MPLFKQFEFSLAMQIIACLSVACHQFGGGGAIMLGLDSCKIALIWRS